MVLTGRPPRRHQPRRLSQKLPLRPRKLLPLKRKLLKQLRPTPHLRKLQESRRPRRRHHNLTPPRPLRPPRKLNNRNRRKPWPARRRAPRTSRPHRTHPKPACPNKKPRPHKGLRRRSRTAPPVSKIFAAVNRARWFARLPRNTASTSA